MAPKNIQPETHKSLAVPAEQIDTLAGEFHNEWRANRLQDDGSYEPRLKQTKDEEWIDEHGSEEVDIANTDYKDLPSDWQEENKRAAEVALEAREVVGQLIHNAWLQRNPWAEGTELGKSFEELPPEEQAKDLDQEERALML